VFEVGIASAKRVAVLCGAVHDADRLADEIDAGAGAKCVQQVGYGRLGRVIGEISSGEYLAVHTEVSPMTPLRQGAGA
jgi:hypothetical protein